MRSTRTKPSAFVYLECKADRTLPLRTVQAITTFLTSNEPDLSAEAITVMDRKGRPYLDRRNPALGKQARVRRARRSCATGSSTSCRGSRGSGSGWI